MCWSSLRHHRPHLLRVFYSLSSPTLLIDMADAASGSTERSVQVKLVLLGEFALCIHALLAVRAPLPSFPPPASGVVAIETSRSLCL